MDPTLAGMALARQAYEALGAERRALIARVEDLETQLRNMPPKTRRRGGLMNELERRKAELEGLDGKLLQLRAETTPPADAKRLAKHLGGNLPIGEREESRWDDLVEKINRDVQEHHKQLNRFVGGAHAAVLAASLAFVNTHARTLDHQEFSVLSWLVGLSVLGLGLSPLHPVIRLLELRKVRAASVEGRGDIHWARLLAYLTGLSKRYGRFSVLVLTLQFLLWAASLGLLYMLFNIVATPTATPA